MHNKKQTQIPNSGDNFMHSRHAKNLHGNFSLEFGSDQQQQQQQKLGLFTQSLT